MGRGGARRNGRRAPPDEGWPEHDGEDWPAHDDEHQHEEEEEHTFPDDGQGEPHGEEDFLPRTFRSTAMTCSTLTIYQLKVMRTICRTMTTRSPWSPR